MRQKPPSAGTDNSRGMSGRSSSSDEAQKQHNLPQYTKHKRPGRRKFFRSRQGKKLLRRFEEEYSGRSQPKNLGRTGPGRIDRSQAVSDWQLAKCISQGLLAEEMKPNAAYSRARSLGLGYGTVFMCDQGEPFTDADLQSLRERCGFTVARFEKLTGLPNRSTDKRHSTMIRAPETARMVIQWRDRALRSLLRNDTNAYKNERVLTTLVPNLPALYRFLADRFAKIQNTMLSEADNRVWTLNSLGNFVCEEARRATKKTSHGGPWGKMLRFLGELDACDATRTFLEKNLSSLKKSKAIARFSRELIGDRYGTTHWTVKRALSASRIPAAEMCGLIVYADEAPQPTTPAAMPRIGTRSNTGGRPSRAIFPEADRLQREQKMTWHQIAAQLDPKAYKHNPETTAEAIRQGVARFRRKLARTKLA